MKAVKVAGAVFRGCLKIQGHRKSIMSSFGGARHIVMNGRIKSNMSRVHSGGVIQIGALLRLGGAADRR